MKSFRGYSLLFLKGIAMGGADVVPGVSGGTIAFITGIYEELIDSIKSIDLAALKLLFAGKFKEFWTKINGTFLLVLFSGILLSLFSLAKLIIYLMENHPISLWSFFFGLILISAVLVFKKIHSLSIGVVIGGIAGIAIGFIITTIAPINTDNSLLITFLSGAIAITAMILPGISGSFILLILGKYEFILQSVKNLKIDVIIVFGIGCAVGLLSFSRLIAWVLRKYHNVTVAVLAGFMLGSLNKIWPWKEVLEYRINSHGAQVPLVEKSILPNEYLLLTGNDPQFLQAILFMLLGIILVLGMERISYLIQPRS
jgi:putative membrane protein